MPHHPHFNHLIGVLYTVYTLTIHRLALAKSAILKNSHINNGNMTFFTFLRTALIHYSYSIAKEDPAAPRNSL